MKMVIREVSKIVMFVVIWCIPVLIYRWTEKSGFLWLFIVSILVTVGIFSHFEDLEKIDHNNNEHE